MALSVVHTYHNSAASTSSLAVTITAPTAGNALICVGMTGIGQGPVVNSISGGGVTWTKYPDNRSSSGDNSIWIGLNSSGSGTTVTLTYSGSYGTREAWVAEVSGVVTSGTPTDGSSTNQGTGSPSGWSTGSFTPSSGADIIIIASVAASNLTHITGSPSGFTSIGTGTQGVAMYRIITSPSGSYNPTWTINTNYTTWAASGVAFKAVSTPSSFIKTVNGLAVASVKTVNGTAKASVKTINGLS